MPKPVEITPEIRQRVMAMECEARGHDVNPYDLFQFDTNGRQQEPNNPDDLRLPSMSCKRCGWTWIVVPGGGDGYDDAERAFYALLQGDSRLAKKIVRNRTKRQDRDKPPKPPQEQGAGKVSGATVEESGVTQQTDTRVAGRTGTSQARKTGDSDG